jgi:tetratricopeptide (TPR) repeat protein
MYKLTFFVALLIALSATTAFAQKKKKEKKLSTGESQALMDKLFADNTVFLRNAGNSACSCIDSVDKAEADYTKKLDGISLCIDKEVSSYELSVQMLSVLKSPAKNNEITMSSKGSASYKQSYYEIERWLKDSCNNMNEAIARDERVGEKSFSKNPEAYAAYEKGVPLMQAEKYAECIPWFEKAVAIDSQFVFAWDNLGVSYRRTGQLDKAENAYKKSLSIEPTGKTALQNIALVYMSQGKANESISAYTEILKHYPGDPETYYGISIVYLENKKNFPLALDYMCKAYNLYIELKSPYRSDAEKVIQMIYSQMKKDNKEDDFYRILKENNINPK